VIKHGAIRDRSLLDAVEKLDRGDLAPVIRRNVEIKAGIVAGDEEEKTGERALLNFGHTIGHGIEAAAGYGRLLHGEAISLGLVAACGISVRKAGLEAREAERVRGLLEQFKLPVTLPEGIAVDGILAALKADKKFEEGAIRFVLCPRLGEAFVSKEVTMGEIEEAVRELKVGS
jgi:3-dehydroquinate synthetase